MEAIAFNKVLLCEKVVSKYQERKDDVFTGAIRKCVENV